MELLVVLAVISILAALILPAVQHTREAAAQTECRSRMRQLGIALHGFHELWGSFPPSGWTKAGPGNPAGKFVGWRVLALPYIEQHNLKQVYDVSRHWWEGTNAVAAGVTVPLFLCPSTPQRMQVLSAVAKPPRPALTFANPPAPTDFEALMGLKPAAIDLKRYHAKNRFAVLHRNSQVRQTDIRDGTSFTIMIVECAGRPLTFRNGRAHAEIPNDQGIGWADSEGPFSFDGASRDGMREGCGVNSGCPYVMNRKNDNEPYSFHPGGANFLFADGHVRFLSENVEAFLFAALCTRDAGETDTPF